MNSDCIAATAVSWGDVRPVDLVEDTVPLAGRTAADGLADRPEGAERSVPCVGRPYPGTGALVPLRPGR